VYGVHGERKRGKAGGGREMISRESLRDEFVLGERKGRWTEERWMVEVVKEPGIHI
jgi:hypothetical protein